MKAVIDIGTNTFHLLIGEINHNKLDIIFKQTIAVKLGEGGGISRGEIIPTAYQRGIDTLKIFSNELNKRGVDHIKATATAAIRDAKNGLDFIKDVYQLTQLKIDVIDGLEEAKYIYEGAKFSGVLSEEIALVMDIGGGSVEFIICNKNQILWKNSFRLGAARLLSDFYNDPLSSTDLELLSNHFENTLKPLLDAAATYKPMQLVGTAGAFDSFRDMLEAKNFLKKDNINYSLTGLHFQKLLTKIINSTHEERTKIKGLIPLRIDMILMAAVLTNYILLKSGINDVQACSYSLKEGLLSQFYLEIL